MELLFSEKAKKELTDLPPDMKPLFLDHLEKLLESPPWKHLKHGIPCHVEKVTKQARIIYDIKGNKVYVLHCFKNHKEYERWYKAYK